MISVSQATQIILDHAASFGEEAVPLEAAAGRVLREDLVADRDFPPFTRVSMDGIAIRYAAFEAGRRRFAIAGTQGAGAPPLTLEEAEQCLEVMTGAVLPVGTDTVIRYEDLEIRDGVAHLTVDEIRQGQNAHPRGLDRSKGDVLVRAGARLTPGEIGVAATIGKSTLQVARRPRIAILYTGDELVSIDETPEPHQIRVSNGFTIRTALAHWQITADQLHLPDEPGIIRERLQSCLQDYDALILSGGVSKGKFDYIPDSLTALGVQQLFHRVKQRPGKPFWFGRQPEGATVFALPGNPVSALMCTLRYVGPWLSKSLGRPAGPSAFAMLAKDYTFKPGMPYFLTVRVQSDPATGRLLAYPLAGRGSGDLANLSDADGFLELPAGDGLFQRGTVFPLYLYRSFT